MEEVYVRSAPCGAKAAEPEQEVHLDEAALLDGAHIWAEARVGGRQAPALPLRDLVQGCGPVGVVESAQRHVTINDMPASSSGRCSGRHALGECALAGQRLCRKGPSLSVLPLLKSSDTPQSLRAGEPVLVDPQLR